VAAVYATFTTIDYVSTTALAQPHSPDGEAHSPDLLTFVRTRVDWL